MGVRGDERGQSIQIGAVILFGALIILFSTYQAFVVPGQNRQVEFNHNQRVQGDLIELRNAILTTKTTGEDGYVTVELGTEFPPRLIALNPTPPSGSLRTTDLRPIVIEEIQAGADTEITDQVCPGDDIRTRFLEYEPNYAEFRNPGTLRYENSLVYSDFGEDAIRLSGQELVRGDTVEVIPLRRSFNRGGSGTIPVEPKAGLVDTSQREDINVTVPTRLSEQQWEDALSGEVAPDNVTVTDGPQGRNLTVTLLGNHRIDCGPVGLGQTPPSGARGGDIDEINPAAPGDIRLTDETRSGDTVTVEFNNTGGQNNFTEARINFYEGKNNNNPSEAQISEVGEPVSETLPVRGDFQTLSPKITLDGGGSVTQVALDFDGGVEPQEWFILTIKLETGETALYFIPVPN